MSPEGPRLAVVSSSMSPTSRSRVGALACADAIRAAGGEADFLDLAEIQLLAYPRSGDDPALLDLVERFNAADGWVVATPTYNFGPSGTLLTFLHYALGSDRGAKWRPFVILTSLAGLRTAMSTDGLARTILHERAAVQVGPPLLMTAADLDSESGAVTSFFGDRIDGQMAALVAYAQAWRTSLRTDDEE
ncbi:hypothetical protein EON79_03045 [bacterium]|nr:MAG: hypothetical protein EON79_03045 [bacterium]